jgi:hypothetical protein
VRELLGEGRRSPRIQAGKSSTGSNSKEMTMTPTEWLILSITTFVVVIVLGVWFYRINSD